jgi:NAD(P)-dependent dehydrogenase (short-subunit alcohol dehydrogenase family)
MTSASRIWVTGASEGIGLGLITHYRRLGWQTVGSSRRPDKPEAADQWVPADLSIAAERQRALDQVLHDGKWPDLVVLNAGIGHWASVEDSETLDSEQIFALTH